MSITNSRNWKIIICPLTVFLLFIFVGWKAYQNPLQEIDYPHHYPANLEALKRGFEVTESPSSRDYEMLFQYFLEGYLYYRSPAGALVDYPGLPSKHGRRVDQLEGFSRLAPLLAAWLYSGRPDTVLLQSGHNTSLAGLLREALVAGTDPASPEYWGDMGDATDQRIVEAADIALVLWMTREVIWKKLSAHQQEQLATWLAQVNDKNIPDNNWHLFVVLTNAVLQNLDRPEADGMALQEHYRRHKTFYRGKGWYTDGTGEGERFDYYNAWAIHYGLYWIDKIAPQLDHTFIQQSFGEYLATYKYFFGARGFPIMGRSTCYRVAAPAPLVLGYGEHGSVVSAGQARRALDSIWSYFIQQGAVRAGTITQGYCGSDPGVLDDYSGQGSCLWSLRSLVAAFALPAADYFWQGLPAPLPLEQGNYQISLLPTNWTIIGDRASRTIMLQQNKELTNDYQPPGAYGWGDRFMETMTHRIRRPKNSKASYNAARYSSAAPWCACLHSEQPYDKREPAP